MIAGFEFQEKIVEGKDTILYRARSIESNETVIIKTSLYDHPTFEQIESFKREVDRGLSLSEEFILPFTLYHEPIPKKNAYLVSKDYPVITLEQYISQYQPSLQDFYDISIRIAKVIGNIHQHRIVHHFINPSSILITPDTKEIRLTDFSFSTTFSNSLTSSQIQRLIEHAAPYLSPEQTGRIGRIVDYRTDFYSLGVTLYLLLTSSKPFQGNDYLEWIHAHIGKLPVEPHTMTPSIPKSASNIVMKLLAKTPDDRYQSAFGFIEDIKKAMEERQAFTLGEKDHVTDLSFSKIEFVGREEEKAQLEQSLENVKNGELEIVLVSGETGVGKSTLIHSFFQGNVKNDYLFLYGKFERTEEKQPYGPLIQAFTTFIHTIVAQGPDVIQEWKDHFSSILGNNINIIAELLPDFRLIVGNTEPVSNLPIVESENRFRIVFHDFIQSLRRNHEPLVLFLDDIQWADQATLQWFKEVVSLTIHSHLLVIGTYRIENKNQSSLKELLAAVEHSNISKDIVVKPFSLVEIENWLGKLISLPEEQLKFIAAELSNKTLGNPLFLHRSLQSIYDQRILFFDHHKGLWNMSRTLLEQYNVSDNVVDLMIHKLSSFSERVRDILHIAACIGNVFTQTLIERVSSIPSEEITEYIRIALKEGLIQEREHISISTSITENRFYMFIHDEIWKAVYAQIPVEVKIKTHWRIGKSKLNTSEKFSKDITYDIVQQLNFGMDMIIDKRERKVIAYYNFKVGKRAKDAIAYDSALSYFNKGLQWLGSDGWIEHNLSFSLTYSVIECLYLMGKPEEAEKELEILKDHSLTLAEKINVIQLKMKIVHHLRHPEKIIATAHEGLKLLGYSFPQKANKFIILKELLAVKLKLRNQQLSDTYRKESDNEKSDLLFSVLESLGVSLYLHNRELYGLHILKMVQLHLKSPGSSSAALTFMEYSILLIEGLGQFKKGYQLGNQALALANKYNNHYIQGLVEFIFGGFINHLEHPIEQNIGYFQRAFKFNRESGNVIVAGGSLVQLTLSQMMCGVHVDEIHLTIKEQVNNVKALRLEEFTHYFYLIEKMIEILRSETNSSKEKAHLEQSYKHFNSLYDGFGSVELYMKWAMVYYSFYTNDFSKAVKEGKYIETYLSKQNNVFGFAVADFWLYYSISICLSCSVDEQEQRNSVKKMIKKLKKWSLQSKENYLFRYLFARGVWEYWNGESDKAITTLDEALDITGEKNLYQYKAFFTTLIAKIYKEKQKQTISQGYYRDAYNLFKKCGAVSLANSVIQENALLLERHEYKPASPSIDAISLIKASHILSKEIVVESILTKLMEIVTENAAAQYGLLMSERQDELFVEIETRVKGVTQEIKVMDSVPATNTSMLPLSVIHYCSKIREAVICENLSEDSRFHFDEYVVKHKPKSVICIPILNKRRLMGMLYLENNLSTSAFTNEHATILDLLISQAAISIENARLYTSMQELNDRLEEKVKERTRNIEQLQRETSEALAEKSVLEERNRIAREIHDVVGHTLTTTIVQMEASKRLFSKDPKLALEKLDVGQQLIRKGLNDIRSSVKMLKDTGSTFDFFVELNELVQQTSLHAGIVIHKHISTLPALPLLMKKVLYHAFQEGVTNAIRHGKCSEFTIEISQINNEIICILSDNGIGTDQLTFGFGLQSMSERVVELNGSLHVESTEGGGLTLVIRLPLSEQVTKVITLS
ncbi:AAA family ATPase [Bacillus alkalicellulosilyticus]|uniref:AAA family ATPase n=1 Tax=Alkalihalobacterium alkalicellulosilyticum TaxID=1912214 RepID=UPI001482B87E|nr:AAA family ATPase [Bacillus alkalicellulosilyticus]